MTVLQDDAAGLVAWVAPGSSRLAAVPVDGLGLRDRPPAGRFTTPRRHRRRSHQMDAQPGSEAQALR
ncbi:MAG TPA: hypothetical protein VFU19_11000 [Iamia sp.]|nr:hypothetical protein [Iamia sp.]